MLDFTTISRSARHLLLYLQDLIHCHPSYFLYAAAGPANLDRVNLLNVSQPEVQFEIALGEVAVSRSHFGHLPSATSNERHPGAYGVAVAPATRQLEFQPVVRCTSVKQ